MIHWNRNNSQRIAEWIILRLRLPNVKSLKSFAVFILLLNIMGHVPTIDASDENLQLVEEIQSEDDSYFNEYGYWNESEQRLRPKNDDLMKEATRAKQIETENERIQKEREESFEQELAQFKEDKAAAKKLSQQKKRDAEIVNRIRKASKANNYYAVLGIRIFIFSNIRIPSRTITIVPNHFIINIPELELFSISEKQMKRAYREMAKLVHPDKSKDPRAVEAFLLVEDAATLLFNDVTRTEYDMILRKGRRERQNRIYNQIRQGIDKSFRIINKVIQTTKTLLGPLTIPAVILVALIV